jgi:cyclopropane-fatty-acyl-phospholipid synthase
VRSSKCALPDIQYKTVAGRSKQYTEKVFSILGDKAHVSSLITSVTKSGCQYSLFKGEKKECVGVFDDVVFACHAPTAVGLLQEGCQCDPELLNHLGNIQYEDNAIYVHSDESLMPKRKAAWASWNCMGKSDELKTHISKKNTTGEAMEGGDSGFGNKIDDTKVELEGANGRMKAVYVTYHLNRLQSLDTNTNIMVSLNPHEKPDPKLVYAKRTLAHPQFSTQTLQAREAIAKDYQGKDGLWFCGAWQGYGFHEDGCRSGFEVATSISQIPLPWCAGGDSSAMTCAPPNLVGLEKSTMIQKISHFVSYTLPVAICKKMVVGFLKGAVTKGSLRLKLNDGSIITMGDGNPCGCDDEPVTLRIFDNWFFVKIAMEYDLGLARSYMSGMFNVEPLHDTGAYDQIIRPKNSRNESNVVLGDPVGLTRLFHLFIGNRDMEEAMKPKRSNKIYSGAFANASGLLVAKAGALLNFVKYRLTMDNSEKGGSLKNIHAHYGKSERWIYLGFVDFLFHVSHLLSYFTVI